MPARKRNQHIADGAPEPALQAVGRKETHTEAVLSLLTDAIADGRLAPGSLHSAQSLATQLGVSRTPVREALLQLVRDGAVRFEANKGVRIVVSSDREIAEVFELREWIEGPAAAQAARRRTERELDLIRESFDDMAAGVAAGDSMAFWHADRRFHKLFIEASGNQRAAQYTDILRRLMLRWDAVLTPQGAAATELLEQHRPILQAIERQEPDVAWHAATEHLRLTVEEVFRQRGSTYPPGSRM